MTAFPRPLSSRMKAPAALPLLCLLMGVPTAADAKVSLGIYDGWGTYFEDPNAEDDEYGDDGEFFDDEDVEDDNEHLH